LSRWLVVVNGDYDGNNAALTKKVHLISELSMFSTLFEEDLLGTRYEMQVTITKNDNFMNWKVEKNDDLGILFSAALTWSFNSSIFLTSSSRSSLPSVIWIDTQSRKIGYVIFQFCYEVTYSWLNQNVWRLQNHYLTVCVYHSTRKAFVYDIKGTGLLEPFAIAKTKRQPEKALHDIPNFRFVIKVDYLGPE
jgi:hypothetical protein